MAASWIGGLIDGVGSFLGGLAGLMAGHEQNKSNERVAEKNVDLQKEINQQNIDFQNEWNQKNLDFQRETNARNEALMREGWARDDTARQRMVSDLEAAGLSKWLAAGASPMNSSPISLSAPHGDAPHADPVHNDYKADYSMMADALSHMYSNFMSMEQTRKQNALLDEQKLATSEDVAIKQAERRIKEHDAAVFENRPNTASTDPSTLKYISELVNALKGQRQGEVDSILSNLKDTAGKAAEGIKQKFHNKTEQIKGEAKERFEKVNNFLAPTPEPLPGQKPMSQLEWMYQNEYKEMNLERIKSYQKYKQNFEKYYNK